MLKAVVNCYNSCEPDGSGRALAGIYLEKGWLSDWRAVFLEMKVGFGAD